MTTDYDIAIIGSGIAGSSLGAILARHGQRVVIFEAKSHPRFAIGESMILETSETMRALAELYDVPEMAYFSSENYMAHIGTSHGVKRHFGFLHHSEGQAHNPQHTLQAVIPKEPHGHELHLYRQDTDYFMMTTAMTYGATVLQNTPISDVVFGTQTGKQIDMQTDDAPIQIATQDGRTITAKYIVDAGGYRSIIANKFNLRDTNLQTHSRAIFTHMVNIPCVHTIVGSNKDYGIPFRMCEGTLHHVFEGGWLWVIPFDNHAKSTNPLCSVGLMLDPRVHPQRDDLTPEAEFFAFIKRFPTLHEQLSDGKAVRTWTRAPRIQYTSKQMVGDHWSLLGHAAGFIDPLYSKGLYISLTSVSVLADLLLQAAETGDYSAETFAPLETVTQNFIKTNDRLVANSYKSFSDYRLWQLYAVLWLMGAYTEYVKLNAIRALTLDDPHAYYQEISALWLAGGGYDGFVKVADQVDTIMERINPDVEGEVQEAVEQIKTIFAGVEWMPKPFNALIKGERALPKNKLRLGLLKKDEGFLGKGDYRQHFFANATASEMLRVFAKEKLKYSTWALNWQRRLNYRQRTNALVPS
ncbi:MAG: NAD(P)/FAD-dependent oxidoreductase [Chloroflexota bacterium]